MASVAPRMTPRGLMKVKKPPFDGSVDLRTLYDSIATAVMTHSRIYSPFELETKISSSVTENVGDGG